jgi:hypothetical protein
VRACPAAPAAEPSPLLTHVVHGLPVAAGVIAVRQVGAACGHVGQVDRDDGLPLGFRGGERRVKHRWRGAVVDEGYGEAAAAATAATAAAAAAAAAAACRGKNKHRPPSRGSYDRSMALTINTAAKAFSA